jgi:D-glycero-D-manno-heptose 1,7-bisphosphate phosphatase
MSSKAVFLDRDGVINKDLGYVYKLEDLHILPDVPEGLTELKKHGFKIVVISNQSGVARGLYTEMDVQTFHTELNAKLPAGGKIDAFYFCPHHPNGTVNQYAVACACRKPGTLLLEKAMQDLNLTKTGSYFIGDKDSDIECAIRFGITGLQLKSRYKCHTSIKRPLATFRDAIEVILPSP